ncbi:hypothetical protein NC651_018686 [Populus alba x Populus x berolinensis]|nr:hypothetical protein NC651_018686 [Populus alba x Populus x berolinensis]
MPLHGSSYSGLALQRLACRRINKFPIWENDREK